MRKVILKTIELHYFKGQKSFQMEFDKDVTEISGPNGSGKSTIADAFTWCLFGKNMKGESDTKFLIKTVDENGVEIPHVNHEVRMVLDVNGQEMELKRILIPEYDKDDNLNGNHTEYYVNEVPLKKSEYDAKVKDIIDESVFKLITSPFAFLTMEWKKQREMLMNMVGEINDSDIASKSNEFTILLSKLTGKTLDEYRKEIACKLSKVNEEMQSIPVRVDELKRNMPICATDESLKRKAEIEAELEKNSQEERSFVEAFNSANAEAMKKVKELNDLKQKQFQILNDAESKERMAIHEANSKYNEAEREFKNLEVIEKSDSESTKQMSDNIRRSIGQHLEGIKEAEEKMSELRGEWSKINGEQFNGGEFLTCPLYGHTCNDDAACGKYTVEQTSAFEAYKANKAERLTNITKTGSALKANVEEKRAIVQGLETQLEQLKKDYESRNQQRIAKAAELDSFMKSNPKKPLIASVKGEDIPEWVDLGLEIAKMEASMNNSSEVKCGSIDEETKMKKESLNVELRTLSTLIANKAICDSNNKRIEELENNLQTLGAEKARLENEKRIADEFEIAKMDEVGSKVNSLFSIVKWQMFTRQVNGELVPACIALVNGVRWSDANTAGMYNAGIDVATSLSKAYNVSAPMFIDNAESIGTIYNPGDGQQIHLRHDKNASQLKTS